MPSNDDLQSLLAKYRVAPQIQATLDNALSRANGKVDQQFTHINTTEKAPQSIEVQPPANVAASPTKKGLDSSPIAAKVDKRRVISSSAMGARVLTDQEGAHETKELLDQKAQYPLPAKKSIKISETVEHYKEEPQRYLGTHSVGTQTPLVLTEENEALRRLQGELDHVKSQLSCLQTEVIKQFVNLDIKLTDFLHHHK